MTLAQRPNCPKRKRGRTYATAYLAVRETREHFEQTGEQWFLYYCCDAPCHVLGYIHQTLQRPKKRNITLNRKLLNIYAEAARSGTAGPKKRSPISRRLQIVRRQIPLMTWQDDGGALHPRELED